MVGKGAVRLPKILELTCQRRARSCCRAVARAIADDCVPVWRGARARGPCSTQCRALACAPRTLKRHFMGTAQVGISQFSNCKNWYAVCGIEFYIACSPRREEKRRPRNHQRFPRQAAAAPEAVSAASSYTYMATGADPTARRASTSTLVYLAAVAPP